MNTYVIHKKELNAYMKMLLKIWILSSNNACHYALERALVTFCFESWVNRHLYKVQHLTGMCAGQLDYTMFLSVLSAFTSALFNINGVNTEVGRWQSK